MTTYAVTYRYVDDESRLGPLRPARYDYFRELEASGHLWGSGQLVGDGLPAGLMVLEAADLAEATALLDRDPFCVHGLVTERLVGRWHATVGTATH